MSLVRLMTYHAALFHNEISVVRRTYEVALVGINELPEIVRFFTRDKPPVKFEPVHGYNLIHPEQVIYFVPEICFHSVIISHHPRKKQDFRLYMHISLIWNLNIDKFTRL